MDATGKQLLNLMFKPGETVCVSPNKYGFHSLPLANAMLDEVTLLSTSFRDGMEKDGKVVMPTIEEALKKFPGDTIQLVSLNPIEGWREDSNCKAFRSFLIEMDYGTTEQQLAYVKKIEMPYSAAIFSGGKSVHFLITIDYDLPNEETWRLLAEWMLGIASLADPNCKNPSRSIRVPGAKRDDNYQKLLEFHGLVPFSKLREWLNKYPDAMPKPEEKRIYTPGEHDFSKIKPWAIKMLVEGLDRSKGRNKQWFSIACEFALAGYSEEEATDILEGYFVPERDFKKREFKTAIRSGFNHIYSKG